MTRKSLAPTLVLTTCLALAHQGNASESASDLTKFVPAPPSAPSDDPGTLPQTDP
jgi:hypothetical protein